MENSILYPKEFIEWLAFDDDRFSPVDDGHGKRIWLDIENDHLLPPSKYERTLDEVYQFWINNIKK